MSPFLSVSSTFTGQNAAGAEAGSISNPYTSVAAAYSDGQVNGILYFQNDNVNSGNAFPLRYASYDSRGWVEVLYSKDSAISTPWDHWLNTTPTRPHLQNYNLSNGGLNYSGGDSSVIVLHSSFNFVDVAFTSKSSVTGDGLTATGQNQGGVYPLVASESIAGSGASSARTALTAYFGQGGQAITFGGSSNQDYTAHWNKAGSNSVSGNFETHLSFRDGSKTLTEWQICDGNNTQGATYAPNIGYRDTTNTYSGANVGSWTSNSDNKGSTYVIDASNVLSIWVSDAT